MNKQNTNDFSKSYFVVLIISLILFVVSCYVVLQTCDNKATTNHNNLSQFAVTQDTTLAENEFLKKIEQESISNLKIIGQLFITSLFLVLSLLHLFYFSYKEYAKNKSNNSTYTESEQTTLINKNAINALAQTMLNLHARLEQKLCFFIVDIDQLSSIFSSHGQNTRDRIINYVSSVFSTSLRETDIISRYDETELLVILPNTGTDEGYRLAEVIRQRLTQQAIDDYSVTVSIGCAAVRKSESYLDVIKRAKDALSCAKHGGYNRTVVA